MGTCLQWRLQGQAYPGIARVFLHTIYHVICLIARGHGLWSSRSRVNLESVEARSVHSQARVPCCLLCLRSRKGSVQSLMMHRVSFRLLHSSVTARIYLTGCGYRFGRKLLISPAVADGKQTLTQTQNHSPKP